MRGTSAPRLPLVSLRRARTITTALPIVALAAEGNEAAVAQGFGGPPSFRSPLGPIVVWNQARGTMVRVPVRGCGSAYDVLLAAGRIAYRCDNSSEGYTVHESLRLGTTDLVRTHGEEFAGSFLGGLVADRGTIAFDVESAGTPRRPEFSIRRTRIWRSTGARTELVRTLRGRASVVSLDAGRIAVLHDGKAVSVLAPGGGIRTLAVGAPRILGAALDGPRLLVLQGRRLVLVDLRSGRPTASWPFGAGSDRFRSSRTRKETSPCTSSAWPFTSFVSPTAARLSSTRRVPPSPCLRDSSQAVFSTPSTSRTTGGPDASPSCRAPSLNARLLQRLRDTDSCRITSPWLDPQPLPA